MVVDSNDFIDLFYAIKEYIKDCNIELLNREDSDTCSNFVEICYKYIKHIDKPEINTESEDYEQLDHLS